MKNITLKFNIYILVLIIILLEKTVQCSQITSAQQIVDIAESALNILVQESKMKYMNKCYTESTQCNANIYNECSNYSPELTCEEQFPVAQDCVNANPSAKGGLMSYDHAAGRCSRELPCNTQEDKEIICSQATLFDNELLRHDVSSPIKYQYVGFYNSFRTIYPYVHKSYEDVGTERCTEYDPRFRPWYVSACTGAKNVVIIIDVSGSMASLGRSEIAVQAAISVIQTLGQQDWFQVIFFNQSAFVGSGQQSQLIQATDYNKETLISSVQTILFQGKTNFEAAFTLAFEVFQNTRDEEFGSQCGQNIMLFLTDGQMTVGLGSADEFQDESVEVIEAQKLVEEQQLLQQIADQNSILDATIFTYSLGAQADKRVPHQIACQTGGIWYEIEDSQGNAQLKTKMRSYYTYLATGLEEDIVWSQTYLDSTTGLEFITAAKAMYVENEEGYKVLLGVAGVDLLLSELQQYQDYSQTITLAQSKQRQQCTQNSLKITPCELESLREEESKCFVASPYPDGEDLSGTQCEDIESSFSECSQNINKTGWVEDQSDLRYSAYELNVCCFSDQVYNESNTNDIVLSFQISMYIALVIFMTTLLN